MRFKLRKLLMFASKQLIYVCAWQLLSMPLLLAETSSGQSIEKVNISIDIRRAELKRVFSAIEEQTNYVFVYNTEVRNTRARFTFQSENISVAKLLRQVADNSGLQFKQINDNILVSRAPVRTPGTVEEKAAVPERVITGTILEDETGTPLPGVNVLVKGTTMGTTTDMDGNFTLTVPDDAILQISFIGFVTTEVPVLDQQNITIRLASDTQALDEVVVVGYGTQKKVNTTGAVTQIDGDMLDNRPVPNLSQGLTGLVPNLNIVLQDGKPTQSPSYNVRGLTSIGQGGSALILIDGVEGDPSLLNPRDIASVTVLKDASSAAVYGARAAFGVVLITTKKPEHGQIRIDYSANYSLKTPTMQPDLVTNGYQWATLFNDAYSAWNDYSQTPQNVNKTLTFSQDYLTALAEHDADPSLPKTEVDDDGNYVYYHNTDWYHYLYKNYLSSMEHNVTVSGADDKSSFLVTGRYYSQDGLFRYNTDNYKMYNLRARGNIQVTRWLELDNNMQFSNMTYHNPLNVGEGGGIWRNLADEGHPMAPMFNPDGTLSYSAAYTVGDFWYGKNGIDTTAWVLKNTTSFSARMLKDKLNLRGNFTFQKTDNNSVTKEVPVPYSAAEGVTAYVGSGTNSLTNGSGNIDYMATNLYAEYEDTFKDKHFFKVLLGMNYEVSTEKDLSLERNGLITEDADDISLALGESITTSGGYERWRIQGNFFRLNYIYNDRYLFEVNGRYDGSSKFPANERYAFFPSASAGWRISNESFWHVSDQAISNLKLRASYGSLGNGNISAYTFDETFSVSQSGRLLGGSQPQYTSAPTVLPDNLTWETATTADIGIDLNALANRLTFNGDFYSRKTTDMYTQGATLPAVFGADEPKGNYADLRTVGWEIVLGWNDQVNVASKPFQYNVRLTLADNQSKILRYNNETKLLSDYYKGQTYGDVWGYVTDRFFTDEDISSGDYADQSDIKASTSGSLLAGDIKFKDLNGDGVIDDGDATVSSHGDKKIIGNTTPRYTYGVMLGAGWNNFFFSAFFQGVGKQDWWPGTDAGMFWGKYNRPYNDVTKQQVKQMWSEENPNTYFPRLRGYTAQNSARELGVQQTRYLQNVAYIRLKNIQIGYNLPHMLAEKIKAKSARLYVSCENLWSWSPLYRHSQGLDVGGINGSDHVLTSGNSGNGNNYPMLKSATLGLNLTF